MDPKISKEKSKKDDSDSGVDNTSESGHSGDEELHAVTSDYEDLLCSDNESNSFKNELQNMAAPGQEAVLECRNNISSSHKRALTPDEVEVRIELNSHNFFKKEYREAFDFFRILARSQCETINFTISAPVKKPDWLDEEKFKRGQKFARDHLFCINFAEMISLFILFAQKSSLGPLIFTGKSDSPFKAFKRYLSTLTKLMTWYEDDIWSESESMGSRNLIIVRGMHKNVYHQLTNSSSKDLAEKITLGDPSSTTLWCPLRNVIVEDFRESLQVPYEEVNQFLSCKKIWINQSDMSMTQFGFVGLAVTYPEYFGIYFASDEDLNAFLHLWRALGYLLGIKDEYNFCNCDLETVRQRTKFFLETIAKPAFREVTCDWEHMCRCLTAGISYYLPVVNFESALLFLCRILEINIPRLQKQGVLEWLNSRLYNVIRRVQKASPEVLGKWENREFSYTKQPGKCPIKNHLTNPEL